MLVRSEENPIAANPAVFLFRSISSILFFYPAVLDVVLVGALRTDGYVHFQQEAGLRLFMQNSFTTFRKRGKTRWDGVEEPPDVTCTSGDKLRYHYQYLHIYLPPPLPPNSYRSRGGGRKVWRKQKTQSFSHSCSFRSRPVILGAIKKPHAGP